MTRMQSEAMPSRHDVNNALADFAERICLSELTLGPDNVASVGIGDEGIVAICFDDTTGGLRLISPVGKLDVSAPFDQQVEMLKAALEFNNENICSLGFESDVGIFLLSLQIHTLDKLGEEIIDFASESIGVAQWLEEIDADASSHDGRGLSDAHRDF